MPGRPPQLDRAVRDLLLAERDFTRFYDEWLHAPPSVRDTRRAALERAQERLDEAERIVARWQSGRSETAS